MAYVINETSGDCVPLLYLPKAFELRDGNSVTLDRYNDQDENELYEIYADVIENEGDSYPYYDVNGLEGFRSRYLSRDTFVAKMKVDDRLRVVGAFYVKPNFPERSSHICNGGFLVHKNYRSLGICTVMGKAFLPIARDCGYQASMFNLVYVNNVPSLKIWRKLGFKEIGRIPKAGRLKGIDSLQDAIQFYYDFADIPPELEFS